MRFLHLSDLHLGKRLNEYSLIEDQEYILASILKAADELRPDAVLIAGDVYDKQLPPAEAVKLLDRFLCSLADRGLKVFLISGNHDSADRLSFGSRLLEASGIHISRTYDGHTEPVVLKDTYGDVAVYMLPFLRPAAVRPFFPDREIGGYTDAVKAAVEEMAPDFGARNILMTHQFVTGAGKCDSEDVIVGGTDNVDGSVFDGFDYVALGHIHTPQSVGRPELRYCGTPLKYSFSEAGQQKSVTVVDMGPKGDVKISTVPLTPLRDMREIKGSYMELTSLSYYKDTATDDYLRVILTDEEDVPYALDKLRLIYPNIMRLEYDNARTRSAGSVGAGAESPEQSPMELFGSFYEKQNGTELDERQYSYCERLMKEIWEAGNETG